LFSKQKWLILRGSPTIWLDFSPIEQDNKVDNKTDGKFQGNFGQQATVQYLILESRQFLMFNIPFKNGGRSAFVMEKLSLKRLSIDTYKENVAYMNGRCPVYRAAGFQAMSKIKITADHHMILAVLNVVHDDSIVAPGELGLSQQAFMQLGLPSGTAVVVDHPEPPASMDAVRRKIAGDRLGYRDFRAITKDIIENRYSKMEMAAFLVACAETGLERREILYYTKAMADSGQRLEWLEPIVADKHCIGGIPGNRTSMLVVPIVAAHGMLIPKTSSRAITSPAGTADTMEVLAEVNLEPKRLYEIVREERGCLAWGGTSRLAPVDDILITVERPLGIDATGQMVSSILSKKLAAGSTHLLLDIPLGPTAKVRHMQQALSLRKIFEYVGDRIGIHLEAIITDGRQPIGKGVGPVLEVRDVMQVLENSPEAPKDLKQKALKLSGRILEFDPSIRGGTGYQVAKEILESGKALEKMKAIIRAQGEKTKIPEPGKLTYEVCADSDGWVCGIDNFQINRIARLAGAPLDKGAGVDLFKKLGDRAEKGEPLYRIHAEFESDFKFAVRLAQNTSGYSLGAETEIPKNPEEF